MNDSFIFETILDNTRGKRIVLAFEDIDRKSLPMWKQHEQDFGRLIFQIKHKTSKLNVYAYTSLDEHDVQITALGLYTNWQIQNAS
jgi:hypothetical protein